MFLLDSIAKKKRKEKKKKPLTGHSVQSNFRLRRKLTDRQPEVCYINVHHSVAPSLYLHGLSSFFRMVAEFSFH